MKFTKMHGCGNDYIYVNCMEKKLENPEAAAIRLSARRFGIGSDGLILICPSETADFEMVMFNADGSRAEMCGNGIRCVGKYVYDKKLTEKKEITIETLAGLKRLQLHTEGDFVTEVTVDMGAPVTEPPQIPVQSEKEIVMNEPITVLDREFAMTCVSMGNPHATVYVDNTDTFELEKFGPVFEKHAVFPKKVNTEFVQIIDRNHVKMRVWERGSGETFACGTGACACAYASMLNHLTDYEVYVEMLGGTLKITYDETKNTILMRGPAVTVYEGEILDAAVQGEKS